jgi:hypothetical protein
MAHSSNVTALAVVKQPVAGTFFAPTVPAALMPISNLRPQIQSQTIDNDEYTGSFALNAAQVSGKTVTMSFNIKVRPPSGNAVPAADAYLPGLILQAAKFTEVRNTAAIPAAPEAVVAGAGTTTTSATLGAGAAATLDLYKGFPIELSDNGTTVAKRMSAITGYTAGKVATLAETLALAPAANYQIPRFLGYYRSIDSSAPPLLSLRGWYGGNRYDMRDVAVTGLRLVVPTSTSDGAAWPEFEVTISCIIADYVAEAAPAVPVGGTTPFARDGDQHLNRFRIGARSFSLDLGITSERPPNLNEADGSEASQLISTRASATLERQHYAKSVFDTLALADAQTQVPFWTQYGTGLGGIVGIVIPACRLSHPSTDLGGTFVNESGDLLIDAFDRGVGIYFPTAA